MRSVEQESGAVRPKVSVIVPAYNEAAVVGDCLRSIYAQTFQDFEVVVVDDASTDGTREALERLRDGRTRILRHENNMGLTRALLTASAACRGEYTVVIGADEQALPDRFARQVAYLDAHPDVAVVGSQNLAIVDEDNRYVGRLSDFPPTDLEIRWRMLLGNPIMTTASMVRASLLRERGIDWDPACRTSQDYKLFSDILRCGKGANLPWRLGITRARQGISNERYREQLKNRDAIAYENLVAAGLGEGIDLSSWSALGLIWVRRYQRIESLEDDRERLIRLYLQVARRYLAKHSGEPGLWRVRRLMALDGVRMTIPARRRAYVWRLWVRLFRLWPVVPLDFGILLVRAAAFKLRERRRMGRPVARSWPFPPA